MSNNAGKVVVVTGGSAGLGRAVARRFAGGGYSVAVLARGEERLEDTRLELERRGIPCLALQVDVADSRAVEEAAGRVERELGPISVWVNCAMTSVFSPFKEMSAEEFNRVIQVTLMGYVHGTMAALKRMLPRDSGTIVQVGSALAYRGIPLQSAYCAAKHGIQGLQDSLRAELLHEGSKVHITMVQMPAMNTPHFSWVKTRLPNEAQPVPPIYQPEVAAEGVWYAAHARRREIWVGKSTALAIMGNKLLPWLGDRYLARTGYKSQQTDEPKEPGKPDNLWEPVPGHQAAHGSFDERSSERSWQLWLTRNRRLAAGIPLLAIGAGVLIARGVRRLV